MYTLTRVGHGLGGSVLPPQPALHGSKQNANKAFVTQQFGLLSFQKIGLPQDSLESGWPSIVLHDGNCVQLVRRPCRRRAFFRKIWKIYFYW
jgi:hypothetical protein